jgi:hypothetical protein
MTLTGVYLWYEDEVGRIYRRWSTRLMAWDYVQVKN